MNYRIDTEVVRIVRTEDGVQPDADVYGKLKIARRALTLHVRDRIKQYQAALAAAVRVKERDLKVEQADGQAIEDAERRTVAWGTPVEETREGTAAGAALDIPPFLRAQK